MDGGKQLPAAVALVDGGGGAPAPAEATFNLESMARVIQRGTNSVSNQVEVALRPANQASFSSGPD